MNTIRSQCLGVYGRVALGGLAAILLAALFEVVGWTGNAVSAVRVLLVFLGALAVGVALWKRPQFVRLYVLASLAAFLARFGLPPDWDSMTVLSGMGTIVAAIGGVMVALPEGYRKVVASVIVLFHFGGILSAVTGPMTPPWVSTAAGILVYRPYLQCLYLTNAYHFYSPEPGPASQVWFFIKYKPDANGVASAVWYKFPRRPQDMTDPLMLSYYRRLSLTMRLEDYVPNPIITDQMKKARVLAAQGENGIPLHFEYMPLERQYRMPTDATRDMVLPSFVRHVARRPDLQHPDGKTPIESIKVYRVEHRILVPTLLEVGMRPYDPTTYLPYYLGEFDPVTGDLLDPGDPLLYWMVPIIYAPNPARGDIPPWHTPRKNPEDFILIDGVRRHTGGSDHNLAK